MHRNYLGLKARISQAWLSPPLIALIIFIVKLVLLRQFISSALELSSSATIMECKISQQLVSKAIQAPHESVQIANKLISASVNNGINGIVKSFTFTITAIESLAVFALDMTLGTYSCLAISAINIGANEALNATESVVKEANKVAGSIGHDINSGLQKLSKFMNGAIGLIDSVDEFITGGKADIKNINMTSAKLDHLNISSGINTKLESLRKDIPTYEKTKDAIESVIKEPFEFVKTKLRSQNVTVDLNYIPRTLSNSPSKVPQCDYAKVNQIFDDLHRSTAILTVIFCVICALAIMCSIALNIYKVWRQWQTLLSAVSSEIDTPAKDHKDPFQNREEYQQSVLDERLTNISTYLETSWFERYIQFRIPRKHWWLLHYALSRPLVEFVIIGIAGITISVMEYVIIQSLNGGIKLLSELEKQTITDVTDQISMAMQNWTSHTNAEIAITENVINTQLLGWINHGSRGVNDSITRFVSSFNDDIDSAFNRTGLLNPMQAAANCIFENKLRSVQKGLTWMNKNTHVELPRISDDLLTQLGSNSTSNLITGDLQRKASKVLVQAVTSLKHEINTQIIVSCVLIAVWLLFVTLTVFLTKVPSFSIPSAWKGFQPNDAEPHVAGIKRKNRPNPLKSGSLDISDPIRAKSPIEKIADRVTVFFSGPAKSIYINNVMTPQKGSIQLPETPSTPLRAMIIGG